MNAARIDIVLPVYNEEADLAASVLDLRRHLDRAFPYPATITIADNASTDATLAVAEQLARTVPGVRARHLDAKGRGRAVKDAWLASDADVVCYMDVDLSTDLAALLPLVAPLVSGHSDVAIGSRLAQGARVARGPRRELISRGYNLLLHAALRTHVSDAQCGFKAMRADVARRLLPLVEDTGWFFDTELLALAERNGLRIHEVPVDWVDDPDSRVDVVATSLADLAGVRRLRRAFAAGEGRMAPAPGDRRLGDRWPLRASLAVTAAWLVWFLAVRPWFGWPVADLVGVVAGAIVLVAAPSGVRTGAGTERRTGLRIRLRSAFATAAAAGAVLAAGLLSASLWVLLAAGLVAWCAGTAAECVTRRTPRADPGDASRQVAPRPSTNEGA